ncbi:unnamed protein product [Periconia digitata]|uniref:HNH nuclease domain-containing protein n=1 Tax=Periconia digitata TaxID=1303443 RepID=A0A9W4U182_9PLEO|nr:unnamed protein product [Periconia digitata]
MSRYNFGPANTLDNLSNALLLRANLHIAFDKPKFVFVPKLSSELEKPRFVIHLAEASAKLEFLYHNRALHTLHSSVETLFALSLDKDGFVSWERCAQFSRKRSQSPKKRKHDSGPPVDDNINLTIESNESRARKKRRCQYLARRNEIDMDEFPVSSASTSAVSSLDLDTETLSKFNNPSEPGYPLLPIESPQATGKNKCSHLSTLSHAWLTKERLRSNTYGEWGKKESWRKNVWAGKVTLEEEEAVEWLKSCGVEISELER